VKLLAGHGANLNIKNKRGLTPLTALTTAANARSAGGPRLATADLLRKLGAVE